MKLSSNLGLGIELTVVYQALRSFFSFIQGIPFSYYGWLFYPCRRSKSPKMRMGLRFGRDLELTMINDKRPSVQ